MNVIFEQLEKIIDKYMLEEKVFVVPSHRDGHLAIAALVKRKKNVMNVKVKTFADLAKEVAETYLHRRKLKFLNRVVGMQFVYEALTELKKQRELAYFRDVKFSPAFCEAAYQALLDLKQFQVTEENFPMAAFLKKEKGEDLQKLLAFYEKKRKENHFVDEVDLYALAIEQIPETPERIYILFPHEAFDYVEKAFFLKLTSANKVFVLSHPAVEGLSPLKEMLETKERRTTTHPLRYVFALEKGLEEDLSMLHLTTAINEHYEIREVLRAIRKNNIPFDKAVIFYTNKSPYIESMLRHIDELGLPVTFAEGIPLHRTKLGTFLKGIFQWIRDDYHAAQFIRLLRENVFLAGALPFSEEKMIRLLKQCEIRFGKERYLQKLKEKMEQEQNEARKEDYEKLFHWLTKWLSFFPFSHLRDKINYSAWLSNLAALIKQFANDAYLAKSLLEELAEISSVGESELTAEEALSFTEYWLLSLSAGASLPKPGHLHISSYRIGLYVDRPYVFIVGMDNNKFPGRAKEDPLLLDEERQKIHSEMTLHKDYVKRSIYLMTQLLLTTEKFMQISFPFMDMMENRVYSPSHLYLQMYRLKTKNLQLTGEELIEQVKNGVHIISANEEKMIHPSEWLAKQLWEGRKAGEQLLIDANYENIVQSLKASAARESDAFTEYDGLVGNFSFDPRTNENVVMSASKLETAGACPYAYFLRFILQIEDEEMEEFDRYRWLDAATRGSLLHKIFEQFYTGLAEKGEKPELEKHLPEIAAICEKTLAKEKEFNPPPSEIIFELERLELLESCYLFLKVEEEAAREGDPLFFEYSFGVSGKEPAEINLGGGNVMKLSGKIDRVDRLLDGTYRIVDYKTGSSYGYGERDYFNGGRKLQHTLYALAFETLNAGENAKVSVSMYSFPTLKGGGERAEREQTKEKRQAFLEIVRHLCDMLALGHFPYTDSEDDCKFCEFKMICLRHLYDKEVLQQKQADEAALGWHALREVRKYD